MAPQSGYGLSKDAGKGSCQIQQHFTTALWWTQMGEIPMMPATGDFVFVQLLYHIPQKQTDEYSCTVYELIFLNQNQHVFANLPSIHCSWLCPARQTGRQNEQLQGGGDLCCHLLMVEQKEQTKGTAGKNRLKPFSLTCWGTPREREHWNTMS